MAVRVTRPPKRRLTPQQLYNQGRLPTRTSTGATYSKVPTIQRKAGPAATFKPAQIRPPAYRLPTRGSPRSNPGAWYPQTMHGAALPPIQFDPNADTGTVQGAISAGLLPYSKYLGKLGYKPPPRAPTELTIPGYAGADIGAGIASDWEMQQALGDIGAANAADEAAARANIEQLAIGWGGDLSNLVKQGTISQKTAEAAKANQFSAMAELGRQLQTGQGRLQSQLASRGILSSGALPAGEAELNLGYQRESTTGLQELMGQIGGIRGDVARARAERQASLQAVRGNIAQRLMGLEQYQPIPTMQAQWDPSLMAYVDPWGRRFDARGKQLGGYSP